VDKVILNGREVTYDLVFKNNKNTYFYFKSSNYIKINASKYQRKKDIIDHMINNASQFIMKLDKVVNKVKVKDNTVYYYFGKELKIAQSDDYSVVILGDEIKLPKSVDHIKLFEKNEILRELSLLESKYKSNPYVNINNIKISTRHTKTRFGSCNARLRKVNFNTNLVHYDKLYLEYVFLHEICHLTHQNHSRDFYELLEKLCPNYKELRRELKSTYNG